MAVFNRRMGLKTLTLSGNTEQNITEKTLNSRNDRGKHKFKLETGPPSCLWAIRVGFNHPDLVNPIHPLVTIGTKLAFSCSLILV